MHGTLPLPLSPPPLSPSLSPPGGKCAGSSLFFSLGGGGGGEGRERDGEGGGEGEGWGGERRGRRGRRGRYGDKATLLCTQSYLL